MIKNPQKTLIWFGDEPQPGVAERLEQRGFLIKLNPPTADITDTLLSSSVIAVFHNDDSLAQRGGCLRQMINHGLRIIFVAERPAQIEILATLKSPSSDYPWKEKAIFIPAFSGTNFDNFVDLPPALRTTGLTIHQDHDGEKLNQEEKILVNRAFPKAEQLHVTPLTPGQSGSKVLMVYEKRREGSIAHWAQPRLVKIGKRTDLETEVGYMKAVAPFVPFELRPNLDVHVEGFDLAVFVADFVEKSESMLEAARAGRADGAISNLFNRTLYRWRSRAWEEAPAEGSLAEAAERLGMISPTKIHDDYIRNERFEKHGFDLAALWSGLKSIRFKHRVASIHGDLHGENVRVRGDDAILIDFGSVLGARNGDAPLCFDVAMLEVALVFSNDGKASSGQFNDPKWEENIRPYYRLDAIRRTPKRDGLPKPTSWLFDCIHRIRAFGSYDQAHEDEYAIALAIALWRWCKWKAETQHEKGRRVVALEIGCEIIKQILEQKNESNAAA